MWYINVLIERRSFLNLSQNQHFFISERAPITIIITPRS